MNEHVLIYRMVHIQSVDFIINNGMWSKNSGISDPNFMAIGNHDVISKRDRYRVKVSPPDGVLSDYVPFYFAGHSPMLLNIVTGYGVTQFPQKDIVFIECDVSKLIALNLEWCFTDGHAIKAITKYYNSVESFKLLDWNSICAQYWIASDSDMDRQRKKMSEFLVKKHVPVETIRRFVVHCEETKLLVMSLCKKYGKTIPVEIDSDNLLFYPNYD